MKAADVIVAAVAEWRTGVTGTRIGEYVEAALRAACGGGDIVITASGALATLEAVEWEYGKPSEFRVVPVERGA